jgi:putative flippase GtrA
MKPKINKILRLVEKPVVRYIIIGGLTYLLEIAFIFLLISSGTQEITAVAIGFWFGLTSSFILQKIFAFKNTTKKINHVARQSLLYVLLIIINYTFTLVCVKIMSPLIGLLFSRTLALVITTGWNYTVYSKVIFKDN